MNNFLQSIQSSLNDTQLEAIKQIDGYMLILAGAGSGKTKTITSRLAYILSLGIPAENTLTLTFTNKAAAEMKHRTKKLLGDDFLNPLLCTFHKFGLLFLRDHIELIGRNKNFVVIDSEDRKNIMKDIKKKLGIPINEGLGLNEISMFKCENYEISSSYDLEIYNLYEKYLISNNRVDFDDLIKLTYEILVQNKNICDEISNKFEYIMVDEYQDTDNLQFKLLQILSSHHKNLCVVGDDDQSIYGWRGAKIENILNFSNVFKDTRIIKLEKNYRSTPQILEIANNIISHNTKRMGKNLISSKENGDEVEIKNFKKESDELNYIISKIKDINLLGDKFSQIAILYRKNSFSRALEEGLSKARIPYKIIGGIRFFERSEIKDIIAYLRLICNEDDDFSLNRIINVPKRGLGSISMERIKEFAIMNNYSLFKALNRIDDCVNVSDKLKNTIKEFVSNIKDLMNEDSIVGILEGLERNFELKKFNLSRNNSDERISNINEFYENIKYRASNEADFKLIDYLNEISLLSGDDDEQGNAINLMSIHSSKGLEFDNVFIIGLENGNFPVKFSDIEEERRLAYVAFTRAKKRLFLTYSNQRTNQIFNKSVFIDEAQKVAGDLNFKKGDLIKHDVWGIGRITAIDSSSKELKLSINFGGIDRKILASFVKKV